MRRRAVRLGVLLGALLLALAPGAGQVEAGDEPGPISLKEHKRRLGKLRNAAGRYITHRKKFPSRCPSCQGKGKRQVRRAGRPAWVDCPQCKAKGAWVSKKDYRAVYFDMRTPAFQALPGVKTSLGKQYDAARQGKPWPSRVHRYRMREREMMDATHGIVWFLYNASKVPTATYWVWVPNRPGGTKYDWFLYDARSDGPWPSGGDAAPAATEPWEPLDSTEARALRSALGRARLTFRPYETIKRGSVLVVRLKPWVDTKGRKPADRVGSDAVRLVRAIYAGGGTWSRIEADFRAQWRDSYGRIAQKPTWLASMSKSAHDSALWNTRTVEDQIRLLDWVDKKHDGWEALEGTRPSMKTTPMPAKPAEPTPAEPTPAEPTPSEPTPAEPTPTPAKPKPPTPVPSVAPEPPPATDPTSFDLPKLTSKAKTKAQKGLARMKALFELAKKVHDEGVMAHRGGSHGLWQEKLAEARTHMSEIEEAWLEDVVEHMPGADEGERDAVANEHFGEIWDDIYKLKAMVRKMSAL